MIRNCIATATVAASLIAAAPASAGEQPAGDPIERHGMEIAGIFLQAVKMEPAMAGQEAAGADIHLEADVVALPGNENGFAAGAWVPYLAIDYTLTRKGSDWQTSGTLIAMVASDGPHYGANVALDGPGEYHVRFDIAPPSANGFLRHYDKETGVGRWWEPFTYEGEFIFAGAGKKGAY
jgi:uncharacterized protein involved in high-affinity Fe2+ transport